MKKGEKTEQRILESACQLFAEKGYRDTTVQDICELAGANVAAVNYYFRNKASLYGAVWKYTSDQDEETHWSPDQIETDPEGWIRDVIVSRVHMIFDQGPAGWFAKLIHSEMANPTELTKELHETFIRPRKERMHRAVACMLGPGATPLQVHGCTLNVASLFIFLNMRRELHQGTMSGHELTMTPDVVSALAQQSADFAIAGIRDLRERLEAES